MYRDSYVPATGEDTEHIHLWDDGILIKKPTATENGEKQYTCLICGQKETQVIDKTASKSPTTSSTGGLILALQRAILLLAPQGGVTSTFTGPL